MHNIAEEFVTLYDSIEPYKVCVEELRDAYVELKHVYQDEGSAAADMPDPESGGRCASHHIRHDESPVPLPAGDFEDDPELDDMERRIGHDMLAALERSIAHDDFAAKISRARVAHDGGAPASAAELDEVMGGYVLVSKQDAVDAMAAFIAACLASVPEARVMEPKQLQKALLTSVQELKTNRVKQLWQWGRFLYRGAAVAYSAFTVYENPWLIRTVLTTLWTSAQVLYHFMK